MSIFKFKQFDVDQSGCAMKINTDGVMLAVFAESDHPKRILDIGTGTGVLALMLAQRFEHANVEAVEIDERASLTAKKNFQLSAFNERLNLNNIAIEQYQSDEKFDLIISNPPFFVNDLKSIEKKKGIARHADGEFFGNLIEKVNQLLNIDGSFWVIIPVKQAKDLVSMANNVGLHVSKKIELHSDESKSPFRWVICLTRNNSETKTEHFYIYQSEKIYTQAYKFLLKDFFLGY